MYVKMFLSSTLLFKGGDGDNDVATGSDVAFG